MRRCVGPVQVQAACPWISGGKMSDLELPVGARSPVPALAVRRPHMFRSEPLHRSAHSIQSPFFPFSPRQTPKVPIATLHSSKWRGHSRLQRRPGRKRNSEPGFKKIQAQQGVRAYPQRMPSTNQEIAHWIAPCLPGMVDLLGHSLLLSLDFVDRDVHGRRWSACG